MKQSCPAEPPDELPGEIVTARRSGISWAWLFPLLALVATGWLYWTNWKAKGPEITISFTTAPGIEPGKTALIYRGVRAGTVSKVHLDKELGKVVVTVSLKAFAAHLATEGTDYWIEQPVISLREIAGLESIIQGNSIHARTHPGGGSSTVFQGLPEAPLAPLDAADLVVKLRSGSIPFLGRDTPVFHRGVSVGWVRDKIFAADGQPEIEVIINEEFAGKVRSNSRFWVLSATAVSASPGSVRLDLPALQGLLDGSISFDHFGPPGGDVKNGAEFALSPDEFAARAEGPPVTIAFEDGAGLRAGETRVTCRGQPVGLVEKITTDPASQRVEVVARLTAAFAPLATADAVFTIIRPSVSLKGVQGLDTLVTGAQIAFEPGQSKEPSVRFVGRERRQLDFDFDFAIADFVKDGSQIVLWSQDLPALQPGAPLYHHGMVAGRVIETRIGDQGRPEVVALVAGKFRDLLRANTRFWRVPSALMAVGIVEQVRVMEGMIEATARFQPGYDFLRRSGSEFAIIRPEIDLKGVQGLDTLVGGVYIACAPGDGKGLASSFKSVLPAEPALMNEGGFEIVLESPSTKIDEGAPISYNDTPVGVVTSKTLSRDGKRILLTARIRDAHSNLVKSNSVFWEAATVEAKVGIFKVEIDTPSVTAPAGRVAFHTPDGGGGPVKQGAVFTLLTKEPAAMPNPKAKSRPFGRPN
jgi:paraquat-inducible protein B